MRRAFLALVLLLAAVPALAQWSCYPGTITVSDGALAVPTPGTGTVLRFAEDAQARAYGWWCPQEYTAARIVLVSGPLSAWPGDWKQRALALLRLPLADRVAAYNQMATVVYPVADGKLLIPPAVFPAHMAVWTALQADEPPAPVWRVAPNGIYPTRPAYAYVDGVRTTTSSARADVDAPCDCAVRQVSGRLVYCAVDPSRTRVSVCTRR